MKYVSLRKLVIAAALLVFSLAMGASGFVVVEGYNFLDAIYMTLLTISTVGFNEVHPLSDAGKAFVTMYIMLNLGILAYVASTITTYSFEGEVQKIFKNIMFGREVKKMKNHVIVCGNGRHGSRACQELKKNNTSYVIIEKDPKRLEILDGGKSPVINGDATLDDTLLMAAIMNARALITTLPHDADNVYITLTAKGLNPELLVISRASDHNSEKKLYRAGADKVVLPDILGALHMANLITRPHVIEFLEILNGVRDSHLKLEEFEYSQLKDKYKDKTLKELDISKITGATVVGVKDHEQGFLFGPKYDTQIGQKDVLILLGTDDSLNRFKDYLS